MRICTVSKKAQRFQERYEMVHNQGIRCSYVGRIKVNEKTNLGNLDL